MKKIILSCMLLMLATSVFSQQTSSSPVLTKQDYREKSKHQKITAFCLAGGGIVVWLAGASKYMNQNDNIDGGGEVAMAIGSIAAVASIPMFIIASKNKRKAASLSINNEKIQTFQKGSFTDKFIPAVRFTISL